MSNILLMGRIGTGKTHSLRSLAAAGVETCIISMEPGIETVLGDIPCSTGLHWKYIFPLALEWGDVASFIRKVTTISGDALAALTDPNRTKYTGFFDVFSACQSYRCDRCLADLGCVDDWPSSRALVMDGLTGLCRLTIQAFVGAKPFLSQQNYRSCQEAVMSLMDLCLSRECPFILLAHTDRELLGETGTVVTTVNAIGQKLAPRLVKAFDEVILSERDQTPSGKPIFSWATLVPGMETKARKLPWATSLPPDFGQLFTPT